ncbi:DNA-directed RNA polymerase, mitochondrial [Wickerhamiella sorbophila]|uniref:DNA-directed RNA polymerase, mitochondrial n=1 Tax=Wickerhamiella sorbophila TaxID=45607 RepID=A0A2T0FJP9_9ASCO|nr:DNA-directed RNA polymerase, mitochondrial [Wickerhamiella sorbophila]PRT55212.1 DNA-directed RNA polymerase, mitochondrial [Wickerhamiella sorbophila]
MWKIVRRCPRASSFVAVRSFRNSAGAKVPLAGATTTTTTPTSTNVPPPGETMSWSSNRDSVPQNAFTSDYSQAWSLLEACLESGNLERAEAVLVGLVDLATDQNDITLAVNSYLLKVIETNAGHPLIAETWLRKTIYLIPRFKPNGVTEAMMLKNAYLSGDTSHWRKYVTDRKDKLSSVLSHIEVLGAQTCRDIVVNSGLDISQMSLDKHTKALIEATSSSTAEKPDLDEVMSRKLADPVKKKGYDVLEPTQSVGLKTIRHMLTGLQLDSNALKSIPLMQEKSEEKNDYDFFELSKQISNEDREAFEIYLDQINEKRQQAIETRGVEAARMKWKDMFDRMVEQDRSGETKVQLKGLEMLLWQWNQAVLPLIKEEFEQVREALKYNSLGEVPAKLRKKSSGFADRFEYGPYLLMAKPENLPAMTMMELLRLNSSQTGDGIKAVKAVLAVGRNVELDCRLQMYKERELEALKGVSGRPRHRALVGVKRQIRKLAGDSSQSSWPINVQAKIGSMLISLLLKVAKVNVYGKDPVTGRQVVGRAPAFYHAYQYQGGNKVGMIRAHKEVSRYLTGEHTAAVISPQQLPMLVQPRPWTAWNDGGYLFSESRMIRTKESPEQVAYLSAASKRGQLQRVYDGLNVLGQTPWTINKDMFKIISKIWNTQKEFLDIPPNVGPQPDPELLPMAPPRDADPQIRRDYLREMRAITLDNSAKYSQRCDLNYKLDIARAFLGERFYMPHNLDFRGRAYPLSPHLNHLGNDVSRSLLMFWNGKKLGENGMRWLKIHLANLFGKSKASFDERVDFVNENIGLVFDAANNPLDGKCWWKEADSPFQALAACIDIAKASQMENPADYVSHLTVHMDGSCNGLQHYAALGGDYEGACEVNLSIADRPQDVYSRVLEIVKDNVAKDAENGNQLAALLHPVLTRKVVKQTVMTHVYGVTFIGAREQISNRLREIDEFPQDQVYTASSYMASKVLGAVRQLFESAHLIQDWLGENALRITRSLVVDRNAVETKNKDKSRPEFMSSVIWTTPLGLPIVQPYRQEKRRQVSTELQTVYITDPYSAQAVNSRKQRTAFPPNYIHSLDATHMLMSAVACAKSSIDFAAVHDSYWTHASSVDAMNTNLRECFVELHSVDLIGELRTEFNQRYGDLLQLVDIPADCEIAQRILDCRTKHAVAMGVKSSLSVSEQIQIERARREAIENGKEADETPVSILQTLPERELEEFVTQANSMKKKYVAAAPRSTEHVGSGLDRFEDPEATDDEVAVSSGKKGKVLSVLVPLRIPETPPRGEFDVRQVLRSPYFFS